MSLKDVVVHDFPTLQQRSIGITASFAANTGNRIFTNDVTQAYSQSASPKIRDIFIRPKDKDRHFFALQSGKLLKVCRPLYGLCDSGDYWLYKFQRFLKYDLNLSYLDGDPSLYAHREDSEVVCIGLLGIYVDDCLGSGDINFEATTKGIEERFESNPRQWYQAKFFGLYLIRNDNGSISISQKNYIGRLSLLYENPSFGEYRSKRAAVACVTHSGPDILYLVNQAAQCTESNFSDNRIKLLSKAIRNIKKDNISFTYRKLNLNSLHIRVYSDVSFGCNWDLASQLGYLILVCDDEPQCHVIDFKSRKSK